MGNICSSSKNQSESEPFSRPGRPLGSNTAGSAPRASVPANAKSKSHFESPGRTLGGASGGGAANSGPGSGTGTGTGTGGGAGAATGTGAGAGAGAEDTNNARANAAVAAQVGSSLFLVFSSGWIVLTTVLQKRAEATGPTNKGKLGTKLAAQKAQTQNQTLSEASRDERAARDADGASAARRWD